MSVLRATFAAVVVSLVAAGVSLAAPTPEQRAEIAAIGTLITKAGNFYSGGKYKEAAAVIKEAQPRLEKLAEKADDQLIGQLDPHYKRLVKAHALLELEGITLPELKPLEAAKPEPKPGEPGAAGGISFVKQVAPILNARCGGCHVRNSRGMFSMSSYDVLMTGPPPGKVVFPGNVPGSDLVVKVEDKEMPPNGAGIPDAELATLKKWIEEGAKFDGPDPKALLTSLLTGQPALAPTAPVAAVVQATGKETVSFAKDIAPVMVKSCMGCHGTGNNPGGDFTLATFERLLRGGERGEPILPGKPADSLLIKKLKGTADGDRMPRRQPPLDDATIAKFEKWIEEGAKFDSPDAKQSIIEVAAIAKALSQNHEQLSADRVILADSNWRLGMPGIDANKAESTNFIVLGNVGENTLADIAQRAEAQAPKVGEMLKAPPDQALVKGRVSLFVFSERYDYGEFGKMVEKRDLPPAWKGHYKFSIVDAYGAVLTPKLGDYSLEGLIAQQLASVYVASQGKGVPHWFAEGTGRVVVSRMITAADSRIDKWDEELPRVLSEMKAPDDFLTNKLPPEDCDIAAYSYVKFLMTDSKRYQAVLDALRKGGDFTKAFSDAYGGGPSQIAQAWARNPPKATTKKKLGKAN